MAREVEILRTLYQAERWKNGGVSRIDRSTAAGTQSLSEGGNPWQPLLFL
jgi:hypothetical protein